MHPYEFYHVTFSLETMWIFKTICPATFVPKAFAPFFLTTLFLQVLSNTYFNTLSSLSDVYFDAICGGNFVYHGLGCFLDWVLGRSQESFQLGVPAVENDVQTMFSQFSFQRKGDFIKFLTEGVSLLSACRWNVLFHLLTKLG